MQVKFLYGNSSWQLEIPDHKISSLLETKKMPSAYSEGSLIETALANPIESPALAELVHKGEQAVVIISDLTRAWVRHEQFLPTILNELNKGSVPDSSIKIISATGDHRLQTNEEHLRLTGKEVYNRVEVDDHNSRDIDNLVFLGATSRGTPVWINRTVAESDRIIITGGIVYHFLAGWGGGKKALIPGVSGRETIMANHSLAFSSQEGNGLDPAVCAGRVSGNPLAEDMIEGAKLVNPTFMVNTVIDEERNRIAGVFAGDFIKAHEAGCEFVDHHFRVKLDKQSEVVIASCGGYPKDINFYQSYKTIYNAQKALLPGGTLFLISESREGIGSDQFNRMFRDFSSNLEREKALRKDYSIGGQMAYHTALIAEENDILVLSSLPEESIRAMGMLPVSTLDEGLKWIKQKHGSIPPCCLMPHGGSTLPEIC